MACTNDIVFPCNQPINKELLALLTPVAFCHALGHVMSNVSFAAVAVSFTHTIKGIKIWGTNAKVSYDNLIDIFCLLVSMKFLGHISECAHACV